MSAVIAPAPQSALQEPTLHSSTKQDGPTTPTPTSFDDSSAMLPAPELRLNGRRASAASLRGAANGARPDDGWGSNFWVTLVDPQVRLFATAPYLL